MWPTINRPTPPETAMNRDPQEKAQIIYVPADRIVPRPEGNVGGDGRALDTTDLQPSIRKRGVLKPLEIILGPNGEFYLEDGYRRWTAARQIDPALPVPVILRDVPDEDIAELRAIFMMSQPHAPLVIDDQGNVTGGWCRVVHELAESGKRNFEIADLCGMTTDAAGAYVRLYDEPRAIKEAVAAERMAITVYSLIKTAPQEMKEFIVAKRGQITASYVREVRDNWPEIAQRGQEESEEAKTVEIERETVEQEREHGHDQDRDEIPTARLLNGALHRLRQAAERELEASDYFILEQIEQVLEGLI